MDLPLLDDDLATAGIIQPAFLTDRLNADMPENVVLCFFPEVVAAVGEAGARPVCRLSAERGRTPVWEIEQDGKRLAVMQPGVGAPLSAMFFEELIALGGRRFVAVGGAGALVHELVLGHAVIVESAVRDEGTSFHYLPPSRVVEADPHGIAVLEATLAAADVPYRTARTWTTDAVYRETRSRIDRRVAEGCIVVEMEASAFIAVARFRGVRFAQLLFAADSLAGEAWQHRGWTTARAAREGLFRLAAAAAVAL